MKTRGNICGKKMNKEKKLKKILNFIEELLNELEVDDDLIRDNKYGFNCLHKIVCYSCDKEKLFLFEFLFSIGFSSRYNLSSNVICAQKQAPIMGIEMIANLIKNGIKTECLDFIRISYLSSRKKLFQHLNQPTLDSSMAPTLFTIDDILQFCNSKPILGKTNDDDDEDNNAETGSDSENETGTTQHSNQHGQTVYDSVQDKIYNVISFLCAISELYSWQNKIAKCKTFQTNQNISKLNRKILLIGFHCSDTNCDIFDSIESRFSNQTSINLDCLF